MMRYEQHSSKSIPLDSVMESDKIRGDKIYEENKHKPIRIMGPMDFSAKNIVENSKDTKKYDPAESLREKLKVRCVEVLRQKGPQTTVEIVREIGRSSRAIGEALSDVRGIQRENIRVRTKKRQVNSILWNLPMCTVLSGE